jgi:uncharacterized protein YoxC
MNKMCSIEIALVIALIACTILIFFIIGFFISARSTIKKLEKTLDSLGDQPKQLLEHTTAISRDLENKLKELEPLFHHASKLGETMEQRRCYTQKTENAPIAELIDWALLGTALWQKFTNRR